jgi:hypothetical protein
MPDMQRDPAVRAEARAEQQQQHLLGGTSSAQERLDQLQQRAQKVGDMQEAHEVEQLPTEERWMVKPVALKQEQMTNHLLPTRMWKEKPHTSSPSRSRERKTKGEQAQRNRHWTRKSAALSGRHSSLIHAYTHISTGNKISSLRNIVYCRY